jgi:predicted MFS family arabinose efflux permease
MIGLLGALAASWFTERLSNRLGDARALLIASIGMGVAFLLQPLTNRGWQLSWYVASVLLAAICIIVSYILQASIRQRLCPPELQGRVSATMSFVAWGAAPIGSLLGGLIATAIGLRPTLWITGTGILLGATWLLLSPLRTLKTIPTPARTT